MPAVECGGVKKKKNKLPLPPAPASAGVGTSRSVRRELAAGAMIALVTLAAYLPAFQAEYIWDDNGFLRENALIHAPDGLQRFWCTTEATDYFPLTSSMLWFEWRIWGNNPHGYHAVNVVLHALAAVVLWRVLARLKVPGAWLCGVLFGVHPVTVASVAWISERKNTLSMVLFLLALLAWLRFEDTGRKRAYGASGLLFVAAMLAKTSVVSLPVVLLVLAWWRRGRITGRDVARASPFFVAGLALAAATVWFHYTKSTGVAGIPYGSFASRLAATGWIAWFYLYKIVLPIHLMMIYPKWEVDGGSLLSYLPLATLAAGMFILWIYRNDWAKGLLAAMVCFLAGVFPVSGLFQMSFSQHSLVSDHLQYVPMLGILAWLAGTAAWGAGRFKVPPAVTRSGGALLVMLLAALTWFQSRTFTNSYTLFSRNLSLNDKAWSAAYSLGGWYITHGEIRRGIGYLDRAIELNPRSIEAISNRAAYCAELREFDRAIADFNAAIRLMPGVPQLYNNRADVYLKKGEPEKALADCRTALEIDPRCAIAHHTKAEVHFAMGQYAQARQEIEAVRNLGMTPDPALLEKLSKTGP